VPKVMSGPIEPYLEVGQEIHYAVFVKQGCPVCRTIAPLLRAMSDEVRVTVYWQDNASFLDSSVEAVDDVALENAFRYGIAVVPTLISLREGREVARSVGWHRAEWQSLTGVTNLGLELPAQLAGCGSRSVEPNVEERLRVLYEPPSFRAREIELADWQDVDEVPFERGWTDGLPVVPPTRDRILRMLAGTQRASTEIVGIMPPNLAPCSIEQIAINAVMAGCRPEYLPVVIAAVEAALDPLFTLHGLVCTTCFSGPIIIVNGPIARQIGMNAGINALGQGNRANATIGRALNLIVRNVGGGIPGLIDRATLGSPSKYTFCFPEREDDATWMPLSEERGFARGSNTVTLFQGEGVFGCTDQRSRTPDELSRSFAMSLAAVGHPKLAQWCNAVLVISPEHHAIFRDAGWERHRIQKAIEAALIRPGAELVYGAQGVGEGIDRVYSDKPIAKFPENGLLLVRAGGDAGLYSAILPGWTGGRFVNESRPVTREICL
jgi:thiol-disulfide isomerase/thioredoxin